MSRNTSLCRDVSCMEFLNPVVSDCINCNIINCDRKKNMKFKEIELSNIKISSAFSNTIPKTEKMKKCREHYISTNRQDRDIVVTENNILIDGYIQYLILKELGVMSSVVKVESFKKQKTLNGKNNIYVYGVHSHPEKNIVSKEYVWKMPKSWVGTYKEHDLSVGDVVLARTKFGAKPIVVTRIINAVMPPVKSYVKEIIKKI